MESYIHDYMSLPFTRVISVHGHEHRNNPDPPLGYGWYVDS